MKRRLLSPRLRLLVRSITRSHERPRLSNQAYALAHETRFVILQQSSELWVAVDQDRLHQVLGNLLSNAAKFSPSGEPVVVSIAAKNSFWIKIGR